MRANSEQQGRPCPQCGQPQGTQLALTRHIYAHYPKLWAAVAAASKGKTVREEEQAG